MTLVDLRDRLVALGAGELDNLELMPSEALHRDNSAININNPDHQVRLLRTIERLEELGRRPALIIFDNLSRWAVALMRMTIRPSMASCNGLLEYGTAVTPFYWFTTPVNPVISAERRAAKTFSTPLSN